MNKQSLDELKVCNICSNALPLRSYPLHPQNNDGRDGRCKDCIRKRNHDYYARHKETIDKRIEAYRKTDKGREVASKGSSRMWVKYRKKSLARAKVTNAIKAGKLSNPNICSKCAAVGVKIQGHHDDYDKPLDVRWLCRICHNAAHNDGSNNHVFRNGYNHAIDTINSNLDSLLTGEKQ